MPIVYARNIIEIGLIRIYLDKFCPLIRCINSRGIVIVIYATPITYQDTSDDQKKSVKVNYDRSLLLFYFHGVPFRIISLIK